MESTDSASKVATVSIDDKLATVPREVELEVTHLDGSKETVKVRQIPISKFQDYVNTLLDEAASIALYCDKKKDWADTLAFESANAIAEKGQEINLPFYAAWFRRQAKWRDSQNQGAIAEMQKQFDEAIKALHSASSAQPSPTTTS